MIGLVSLIKTPNFWVLMGSNVIFKYDWPIKPQNLCSWLVKSSQSNFNLRLPDCYSVRSYLITTVWLIFYDKIKLWNNRKILINHEKILTWCKFQLFENSGEDLERSTLVQYTFRNICFFSAIVLATRLLSIRALS